MFELIAFSVVLSLIRPGVELSVALDLPLTVEADASTAQENLNTETSMLPGGVYNT